LANARFFYIFALYFTIKGINFRIFK